MTSQRKRLANQRNAKKSTGPRTEEGKCASSQNATTHGLTASSPIVLDENPAEFAQFAAALRAEFRPATAMQRLLVDRIVFISWKLKRVPGAESAAYEFAREWPLAKRGFNDGPRTHQTRATAANVLAAEAGSERLLGVLQQYETRLERSLHATLRQLATLKKLARDEPVSDEPWIDETLDGSLIAPASAGSGQPTDDPSPGLSPSMESGESALQVLADAEEAIPQNEANLENEDSFSRVEIARLETLRERLAANVAAVNEFRPHHSAHECPPLREDRCEPLPPPQTRRS